MSRTVFDQFGVADGGPDSAVDIGSVQVHLRWVDTDDFIVSLPPIADGPAESAGPVATSSAVPGAGAAPAPAVVVTPQHHDELRGGAAAAPSAVPGIPRAPLPASRRNRA
ncbi:MAG: hypothetical protein V9E81_12410 [Marmoricola sp.]